MSINDLNGNNQRNITGRRISRSEHDNYVFVWGTAESRNKAQNWKKKEN